MNGKGAQGVLDLMGNTGGQGGEARQIFRPAKLGFLVPLFGDVLYIDQGTGDLMIPYQGKDADTEESLYALEFRIEFPVLHPVPVAEGGLKKITDLFIPDNIPNGTMFQIINIDRKKTPGVLIGQDQIIISITDQNTLCNRIQNRLKPVYFSGSRDKKFLNLFHGEFIKLLKGFF
jgi:hypothetical protein